ncbi:MAG: enoyl-CoA hydratase-related protein, partial [Bosea sp. (in: a-proteobacteria)]
MTAHQPVAPVLLRHDAAGVATLTLNRPDARHALSEGLIAALSAELDAITLDESVRCVILASQGPVFCAGHDLKEMTGYRSQADRGRADFTRVFTACSAMMQRIVTLPKPVIAAVEGLATAAG